MTLQNVAVTVADGNLGATGPSASKVAVVVGFASAATPGTPVYVTSLRAAKALGFGPGAEECAHILANAGVPVIFAPVANTAGVVGSVTPSGGGPTVTVSGNSYDALDFQVLITLGGAVGASKFKYTADGQTWSPEAFTASSYPVAGTGITLNFAAGTYVLNETYSFTAAAPTFTTTQMGNAIDSVIASPLMPEFSLVKVAGVVGGADDSAKATACAAMAAALQAKLAAIFTSPNRYVRGGIDAPRISDTALASAFASFVGDRVWVCARFGRVLSEITGRQDLAPVGRILFSEIPAKPLGKDPSQVKETGDKGVGALPASLLSIESDEKSTTTPLESSRFVVVQTRDGKKGFYCSNWWLMGAPGTDYRYLQDGQVIDAACRVARIKALDYLSLDLDLNEDGTLEESQAKAMDQEVLDAVKDEVVQPKAATAARVVFDRTVNVASTEQLQAGVGVRRKGYPKWANLTVGFMKAEAVQNA